MREKWKTGYDPKRLHQVAQETLPDDEDQRKYYQWVRERFVAVRVARMEIPAATVEDYRDVIIHTNIVDTDEVRQLMNLLDRVPYPYIGIGHHKGQHYRLKPMTDLLDIEDRDIWIEDP